MWLYGRRNLCAQIAGVDAGLAGVKASENGVKKKYEGVVEGMFELPGATRTYAQLSFLPLTDITGNTHLYRRISVSLYDNCRMPRR